MPNSIEPVLGIPRSTAWSVEFAWPGPAWTAILMAVLSAILVVALYLRQDGRSSRRYRLSLAAIRLAVVAIAMLMIAQASLSLVRTARPQVVVLLDDSRSMTTVDEYTPQARAAMAAQFEGGDTARTDWSRWGLLGRLLGRHNSQWLRRLARDHALQVDYLTDLRPSRREGASGIVEEVEAWKPRGESTRLGGAIGQILDQLPRASRATVVVLTDGVNTDGPTLADAAQDARRRGVPLYFIGLGSDRPAAEVKLSNLVADQRAMVDDLVTFECTATARGLERRTVPIVLRRKDSPAELARTVIATLPDGRPQPVRLSWRPREPGRVEYTIAAEPKPDEPPYGGNRLWGAIDVRTEKISVLLAAATPSFEYRYLSNLLRQEQTVALKIVLQDADPEQVAQDAAALRGFPLRRDELFGFDAVILDDPNPALLGPATLADLAAYVGRPGKGGALVVIAGPGYMPAAFRGTPLAGVLPIIVESARGPRVGDALTEGFVVRPTELGLASPGMQLGESPDETGRIWRNLPPLYWLLEAPELKPGARILAEHPTRVGPDGRHLPVICFQYVGAGRVLFHATDETWRWRCRAGDLYFGRYWIQTLRWLCHEKLAEAGRAATLAVDRREGREGEPVRLRASLGDPRMAHGEDEGLKVAVERSGGKTYRLDLRPAAFGRGTYEGTLDRLPPGNYRASIVSPSVEGSAAVDFVVAPAHGELTGVPMDAAAMRRAAKATGGQFYTFADADRLLDDLPPGRPVPVETLPPLPLWNRWPALALFLGLLTAEWILRKRSGMV